MTELSVTEFFAESPILRGLVLLYMLASILIVGAMVFVVEMGASL